MTFVSRFGRVRDMLPTPFFREEPLLPHPAMSPSCHAARAATGWLLALLAAAILLWTAVAARAEPVEAGAVIVDCDGGDQLAAALRAGLPILQIRGTCREDVVIARDRVRLIADPRGGTLAGRDGGPARIIMDGGEDVEIDPALLAGAPGVAILTAVGDRAPRAGVLVTGAVAQPGLYAVAQGAPLSSVIAQAGGLLEDAYPYGAVLTRPSVADRERQRFLELANQLRAGADAARAGRGEAVAAAVASVEAMATTLEEISPAGRVVVEADPTVLQVRPDKDSPILPGDRLHIPVRPTDVAVRGRVLNPSRLPFESGQTAEVYIEQAGGFDRGADRARIFLVYPDGQAELLNIAAWNYEPTRVPPGSTLVVPQDPTPFSALGLLDPLRDAIVRIALADPRLALVGR